MALRFNPPPNWPAPPEGFVPPAGWQPDPAWGPAPEGWQLWVDDSIPEGDGTGLAPTQVVSTGSPVVNPSSPSIGSAPGFGTPDPMMGAAPAFGAPEPVVGSAPSFGASAPSVGSAPASGATTPLPAMASSVGSAPSASPYAANLDYAQAPTPYHSSPSQPAGWQPVDVAGAAPAGSTPVTKQWWFWAIIVAVVVALIAAIALALTLSGGDKETSEPAAAATSATTEDPKPEPTGSDGSADTTKPKPQPTGGAAAPSAPSSKKAEGEAGTTRSNPIDPATSSLTFKADKFASDPDASIDVTFGAVKWNANDELKEAAKFSYKDPGADKVYIRLPVTVTYHGKGQMSFFDVRVDYVADSGSSYEEEFVFAKDEFDSVDMPRDGGTATGYFTFVIPTSEVNKGVFAVKGFHNPDEVYVQAK